MYYLLISFMEVQNPNTIPPTLIGRRVGDIVGATSNAEKAYETAAAMGYEVVRISALEVDGLSLMCRADGEQTVPSLLYPVNEVTHG